MAATPYPQPGPATADAGQSLGAQMGLLVLYPEACSGCGACIATCPTLALRPAPRAPSFEASRCTVCLECMEVCPTGAIAYLRCAPQSSSEEGRPNSSSPGTA